MYIGKKWCENQENHPLKKLMIGVWWEELCLKVCMCHFLFLRSKLSAANHETGRIGRLNFFRSFQLNIWAKMRMLENSHHVPSLPHPSKNISNQVTLDSLPSKSIISSSRKTSFTRSPFRKFSWHHQHQPGWAEKNANLVTVYRSSMWKPDGLTKPQIQFNLISQFLFFVILFKGEPDGLRWNWRVLLVSFVNAWHVSSQILVCTAASDSTSTRLIYLVISYKGLSSRQTRLLHFSWECYTRRYWKHSQQHSSIHLYTLIHVLPQ